MGGNLKPDFVEERRAALEKYLGALVEDSNAAGSPDFRAFIDANRGCSGKQQPQAPQLQTRSPEPPTPTTTPNPSPETPKPETHGREAGLRRQAVRGRGRSRRG
jgi:hypothetical protein